MKPVILQISNITPVVYAAILEKENAYIILINKNLNKDMQSFHLRKSMQAIVNGKFQEV